MKHWSNGMKIPLIVMGIILSIALFVVIGWVLLMTLGQPRQPALTREEALAKFMPEKPKAASLVREGYDPKSYCFDKCGYLYRLYSYTDQAEMCNGLFAVFVADDRFTITSPSTDQLPTEEWCADRVKRFTLDMEASVVLKTGVREASRTVASVVVDPDQKLVEYRVSEINEGMTLEK